jgi:hypothetical protein
MPCSKLEVSTVQHGTLSGAGYLHQSPLSIVNSERWADPNSSVPSNTIFHRIYALQEESASCCETP